MRRGNRAHDRSRPIPLLALGITLLVTSCIPIPYKSSNWISAAPEGNSLQVGDEVRVKDKGTGKHYVFEVAALRDDGFSALQGDKRYHVLYADLVTLEVKRGEWQWLTVPISHFVR